MPRPSITPAQQLQVVRLYKAGHRIIDIARRFNIYSGSVTYYAKKHGASMRKDKAKMSNTVSVILLPKTGNVPVHEFDATPDQLHDPDTRGLYDVIRYNDKLYGLACESHGNRVPFRETTPLDIKVTDDDKPVEPDHVPV